MTEDESEGGSPTVHPHFVEKNHGYEADDVLPSSEDDVVLRMPKRWRTSRVHVNDSECGGCCVHRIQSLFKAGCSYIAGGALCIKNSKWIPKSLS